MKTQKSLRMLVSASAIAVIVNVSASQDYGPANWYGACNYSTSGSKKFFVVHDMEGYYWSSIYYLARCSTQASVHYCVNGKKDNASDANPGAVTQMVRDAYSGWHARCWNYASMGTEHEGFASNPAWYTDAMYDASASLTGAKCNKYNMAKDRNHVVGHDAWMSSSWRSYASSNFGVDPSCNTHHDPGPYWKWTYYMDLIKGNAKPQRPTSLQAKVTSWQRVDLKWQDNSNNENHFEIQKMNATSGGSWNDIHHNGPNNRDYAVRDLSGNTKYKFRVRACNGGGNSEWSNVETVTTFDKNPPDKPTSLTALASNDDRITLNWNDNSGNENGFTIQRKSAGGTSWTKIKDTGANVNSYVATGLRGNRTYFFRVRAFNSNEPTPHSDWSNEASDTTPPTAPSGLVATAKSTNSIFLKWDDNSGAEVGFKIERSLSSASGFSQVATNVASDPTYLDTGLAADTKYYYRVRTYNFNGNSMYSNVDSATTFKASPIISAVGNKTIAANSAFVYRVVSTDPNQVTDAVNFEDFQSYTPPTSDGNVMFKSPIAADTTSAFVDTTANVYSQVVNTGPSGNGSTKVLQAHWKFLTGTANWMRLLTRDCNQRPNPVISLNQSLRFKLYSDKAIKVALGVRETTGNPGIGGDGGTVGDIEWVGVTNRINGVPQAVRSVPANTWTTVIFNCQKNEGWPFVGATADGQIKTGKGVLEHVAIIPDGTAGLFNVYMDDFNVVTNNTLTFSLDSAPAGMTINEFSGDLRWTPTSSQVGNFSVTVRVTDQSNKTDVQTFTVTVTGAGNNPPALTAIGNKTINEGSLLTFTATASDPDAGQTKTFTLDAGAPSGASIGASSGVFSWTPSESQGGAAYPITVRVTDNGSPSSNDFETITVTVNEVNNAPVITAIADQTVNETQAFNYTVAATDSDLPAQTKLYELLLGPLNMTINTNTGALSWATVEADGPDTNEITVRVTDNGSPKLWAERTFNVIVNELNTTPVLTVSNAASTATTLTDFENYEDGTYSGTVMFRQPSYSGSTSAFIDTTLANITTITTNSPGGLETSVLTASFAFKTGQVNPWVRITTDAAPVNEYSLPNPTIDLGKRVKFDVYSDKSIKLCLGVRETGVQVPIGDNGGQTGAIEWVGATGATGGAPICTRTIAANTWTTVDFDLPNEPITALTGNGSLAPGKGVLEQIAIVPNGGSGVHNVYFDSFITYSSSTNMTVNTAEELTLDFFATDADRPSQLLTFSLDAGAPTNAVINDESGEFTWIPTPEQSPSTNVITVRVTDNGPGALSAVKNVTIKVNKVNTPPLLGRPQDFAFEQNTSQTITFTNSATDGDIPADTLTFSLTGVIPSGATINSGTGVFTWTPATSTITNYFVTVRVTDNGVPPLYTERQFAVKIVPVNTAPTLSLGTARVTETIAHYETFANNTADGTVMFRKPTLATQTSGFLDTVAANSHSKITNSFPAGNPNGSGTRALVAKWSFKTGTANYWVRLTSTNATSLPNPTVDLAGRVRFNIHSSKAIKVGLGIRETGTSAEIGANGGTTSGIEWIGVTNVTSGNPIPNRLVPANTWTTLEYTLPSEPCMNFSGGNGVLATGKGVLECLAIRGEGGTGIYTVYVDNFSVVNTATLPTTVTMKTGSTLTFTATATDPNPGSGLSFGLDSDFLEAHTNAAIDSATGAFTWTPVTADAGTTSPITVTVSDEPTNGGIAKSDSKTFSVVVNSDTVAPQSADAGSFVAGGDTIALSWDSVAGTTYSVQSKTASDATWSDVLTVTATGSTSTAQINNTGDDTYYRVIEISSAAAE